MTVEVDEAQASQLMKAAAQRISRRVQIPGFRPGKAPYALIERRVGQEVIRKEVLEDLSDKIFREALKQADVEPFAAPSMADVSWQPLTMKVRIPVAPVVELGDYHALRLPVPAVEVDEAEVDAALARLQEEHINWKPVDRPAQFGDRLLVAARVVARGKTVVDEKDTELDLDEPNPDAGGPDIFTPLIGARPDEERQYVVHYPPDYGLVDLAGAEATVKIHVKHVLEKEVYPLDDDFAQMVGDFSTLADLRERVRADLLEEKQRQADHQLVEQAFQEIIAGAHRIEWPLAAEEEMLDHLMHRFEQTVKERGLLLDDYLRIQQKTRDQMREESRPKVQEQLRRSCVADEIARREGITVESTEIANLIEAIADAAGERSNEVWRSLISEAGVRQTARDLLDAKIRGVLLRIVKGEWNNDASAASVSPGTAEAPASTPMAADTSAGEAQVSSESAPEDVPAATSRKRRKPKAAPAAEE